MKTLRIILAVLIAFVTQPVDASIFNYIHRKQP